MWVNLHTIPAGQSMYTVGATAQPVETPEDERSIEELDIVGPSRATSTEIAKLAAAEVLDVVGPEGRIVGVANQSDGYVMREDWNGIPTEA